MRLVLKGRSSMHGKTERGDPVGSKPMRLLLLGLLFFGIIACGDRTNWYKPGQTATDLAVDQQQCRLIAKELARQESLTPENPNLAIEVDRYGKCMMARGWRPVAAPGIFRKAAGPTSAAPTSDDATVVPGTPAGPHVAVEGRRMQVFGVNVEVPEGFELRTRVSLPDALVSRENLLWRDPQRDVFFQASAQQSHQVTFEEMGYPYDPNKDLLYQASSPADSAVPWRAICLERGDNLIGLVGSVLRVNNRQRLFLNASIRLPAAEAPPADGLRLSTGQYQAMEGFTETWAAWFESQFPPSRLSWNWLWQWIDPLGGLDTLGRDER